MIDIIVTEEPALVRYMQEQGIVSEDVEVLTHVDEEQIRGKVVAGVLPLHLAASAKAVVEVPLNLSPEDRGKELSIERVREIAGPPKAYVTRSALNYGFDLRDGSQWYESYLALASFIERQ